MIDLRLGDCFVVVRTIADYSADSVVCDPPYGLQFMNKHWDYDIPSVEIWQECLRVLKPGGHLLAFAGTRTHHRMACRIEDAGFEIQDMIAWVYAQGMPKHQSRLKPAIEPITMARKPAKSATLLNIDACRIKGRERTDYGLSNSKRTQGVAFGNPSESADFDSSKGRYPSNLIHDGSEEVVSLFPESLGCGGSVPKVKITGYGDGVVGTGESQYIGGERIPFDAGSGSAARFFYCAKANKKDRGEGNNHPTVKPNDLMRYLCRLVTPPNGIVLDPFMGSGSTGKAAVAEGFRFIGIEMLEEYFSIAHERITGEPYVEDLI